MRALAEPEAKPERVALVVLGMHRSGTSALTRVLSLLGADLPSHLIEPSERGNPTGFWEPKDLVLFSSQLLESIGSSWEEVMPLPAALTASRQAREYELKCLEVLRRDFSQSPLFVLKDPRMCRLVPLWERILDRFASQPRYVLCLRNPIDVGASLKQRYGFPEAKSQLIWLRYTLDAENATRGSSRSIVLYEDLLEDWRSVAEKVSTDLGVGWPRCESPEIEKFLCKSLRHHRTSDQMLMESEEICRWVKDAYRALHGAIRLGANPAARLDEIATEVRAAEVSYGQSLTSECRRGRRTRRKLAAAQTEVQRLTEEVENSQEINKQATGRLHESESQAARLQEDVTCLTDRVRHLIEQVEVLQERERGLQQRLMAAESTVLVRGQSIQRLEGQLCAATKAYRAERKRRKLAKRRADLFGRQVLYRDWLALLEQRTLAWRCATSAGLAGDGLRALSRVLRRPRQYVACVLDAARSSQRSPVSTLQAVIILRRSFYFDEDYYRRVNPDVAQAGMDPVLHYLQAGAHEGRSPHPHFNTEYYLRVNRDVAACGMNPLLHFELCGKYEGRETYPGPKSRA